MKKKLFAAAILVLVFAGSAIAAPGYGKGMKCGPGQGVSMGYGQSAWQNITPEVKAKIDERAKLNIDMRSELQKEIPNKAKARDIHEKIQKLNRDIEAAHSAEYCYWRCLGCHAARVGLGRHDGRCRARGSHPVSHYFPLDPAALLGAGSLSGRGLPKIWLTHAAGNPRQRIHAVADSVVHLCFVCCLFVALCVWHEQLAVPRGGCGAWIWVLLVRLVVVARLFR